jgi:hypothetical protein
LEDDRPYLVEFHAPLDDRAQDALSAAGVELVGSRGGGALAPGGGTRDEMDRRLARVFAPGAGEAAAKVRDALAERDVPFHPLGVEPDRG